MRNLFYFVLATALFACTPKKESTVTINITATGLANDTLTVSLASADSTLTKINLTDGEAIAQFDLAYPQMVVIQGVGLTKPIVFFADLAEQTLTIDGTVTPPTFKLTGSVYQDSLEAFSRAQEENRAFMERYYPTWEQSVAASDSLTTKIIEKKLDSAYTGFEEYTKTFAKRNGIVGAMIAQRYIYTAEYQELKDVYDGIPAIFKFDQTVIDLKSRVDILENTQIGKRYTEITQNDTTGKPLSIGNVKGEYVLIDFWASWCGPCRQANPDLVKLYEEFHPKGFEIVGVSLDQKEGDWKQAIVADNLMWPQMSDLQGWQNAGAAAYAIRSIPQSILLDNQGFIIRKNLKPEELRAFLSEKL
jgi:thiol-disulfide isomerase/thioredoxin